MRRISEIFQPPSSDKENRRPNIMSMLSDSSDYSVVLSPEEEELLSEEDHMTRGLSKAAINHYAHVRQTQVSDFSL